MKMPKFLKSLNLDGLPIPTATDPATSKGSVTFMLVCLSGLHVMLGIWSVPNIDKTMAEDWFLYCLGGYLGRTIVKIGGDKINGKVRSSSQEPIESDPSKPCDICQSQCPHTQKTPDPSGESEDSQQSS